MTDPAGTDADSTTGTDGGGDDAPFRDAESFLADLGVERRPIVVRVDPDDDGGDADAARTLAEGAAPLVPDPTDAGTEPGTDPATDRATELRAGDTATPAAPADGAPPVSAEEAARIATETVPPDELETALSYVRRSTAAQPASEGRLRSRLADRGHGEDVIAAVLAQARAERLVDDDALSAALVAEWRAKGHAPRRVRRDLRRRGFDEEVVERAVGTLEDEDQGAVAFQLARERAETLAHLPPETAFRRVAGFVARRGYGDGLARKAARDAVYDQRHDQRIIGR